MEGKSFWMDEERDGGLGRTRLESRLGMNIRRELQRIMRRYRGQAIKIRPPILRRA
jgi:hypothetical protein